MSQSSSHYFSGYINDGAIYAQDFNGTTQIGVTLKEQNELQAKHDVLKKSYNEYQEFILAHQDAMVKAGIIEQVVINIPLSSEDIVKKQAGQIDQLQSMVFHLTNQLQSFIGAQHGHHGNDFADSRGQSEVARSDDGSGQDSLGHVQDAGLETGAVQVRSTKQRKVK